MRSLIVTPIALALVIGIIATALPLVQTDWWWVRYFDFPRLQIAGAMAVLLLVYILLTGWRGAILTLLALAALGLQARALWPYQPLARQMVAQTPRCADDGRLRVLIANVQRGNQDAAAVIAMARAEAPDIFLVMETNARWDRDLAPLDADFPHKMQALPEDATFFGMHVFSRLALDNAQFEYPFDSDTPLFVGDIAHPRQTVQFIGIHPRPPQRGQSSTMRDATVLHAATLARDSGTLSIVAGDYNATPWEDTGRLAMRVAL